MAFKTDLSRAILLLLTHVLILEANICRQSPRKEFVRLSNRNDFNKIYMFFSFHRCYHEGEITRYMCSYYGYVSLSIWFIL